MAIIGRRKKREPLLLPDYSAHHLRHTFCTRLCENETNLKVIQSLMGHKDIQTTMDIYADCTFTNKSPDTKELELRKRRKIRCLEGINNRKHTQYTPQ